MRTRKIHRKFFIALLLGVAVFFILRWNLSTTVTSTTPLNLLSMSTSQNSRLALAVTGDLRVRPSIRKKVKHTEGSKCPDILSGMTEGRWETRSLTEEEQRSIDGYVRDERVANGIPPTYQRDDGRCGDVPYKDVPFHKHMWFRAICDPKGLTPCCHTNSCVPLSLEDCRCSTCYDERQAIHAEYAQWRPTDDRCSVMDFSPEQACDMLSGMTLYFVGDSFIRHVFVATVVLLTNSVDGALKTDIPLYLRDRCSGLRQVTSTACREYLDHSRLLCNGMVNVTYIQIFGSDEVPIMYPLLRALRHVTRSIIILGLGIHNNFNVKTVARKFLLPVLNLHNALSSNLTRDVNLAKVVTDFGSLDDTSATSEHQRSVGASLKKPRYEYLMSGEKVDRLNEISSQSAGLPQNQHGVFNLMQDGALQEPPKYQPPSSSKDSVNFDLIVFNTFPESGVNVSLLWPRLIWVGTHAPGLLKSSLFQEQTANGVQSFNKGVYKILDQWKVPYLDTFSFSSGTVSFDGTHYGWGINMLKARMLLTYIQGDLM